MKLINALKRVAEEQQQTYNNTGYGANTPTISNTTNKTNTISNADNRQVIMNNQIMTSQTGDAVINDLSYAQNYAFSFA